MTPRSYVALGDSFTEGVGDPYPDGTFRGWADRVAEVLAAHDPAFEYANLAVRGKLLDQIVDDQLPLAVKMAPDLVSFCAGGNDLMRPGSDPDQLAKRLASAVRQLRSTGAEVLLFTGVDPRDMSLMRRMRGKFALYYLHVRSIADLNGCLVVDQWSMQGLRDRRAWCSDRIHLNSEGHRLVAARILDLLGVPSEHPWRYTWPEQAVDPRQRRREDARWLREFLMPWINRRLRGTSSGDGVTAKRPELGPWS
ncbi:SGNH/GDSL hydrolase family protein [Nonomuraea soli]|uniref:Lysophospholipase L1-like esterase n=1 Tax=Nonomuraea soli TaxID=1032476 RepID=A0A7W0CP38_9ACTN|nr:SGNH/GDSL hydrolase family protein [Nonomuraea soli]MBA2894690.1 lysophospholipase L1-like esterase [Nonomuraea soli]